MDDSQINKIKNTKNLKTPIFIWLSPFYQYLKTYNFLLNFDILAIFRLTSFGSLFPIDKVRLLHTNLTLLSSLIRGIELYRTV